MSVHAAPPDTVHDIWVVEDNPTFQQVLVDVLASDTLLLCTLATHRCEDVLRALRRGLRPALVLLDLGLPGLGGLDGLRQMRQLVPDLAVLIVTIESEDQRVFDALAAGACGYLLKPATSAQLLDGIHAALGGGSPISPAIARKVLTAFSALRSPAPSYGLTEREAQILRLLVEARTQQQIASMLELSRHTVDTHVRRIYEKLQVNSRAGAVAKATRERLS